MNSCFRLLVLLAFLAASHALAGAPAIAQDAAAAASASEEPAGLQVEAEEEDQGFWGSIASSILDFFDGDSEETDETEGQLGIVDEDESAASNRGQVPQENSRNEESLQVRIVRDNESGTYDEAAVGDGAAPHVVHRRLSPRQVETGANALTFGHVYRATVDLISEIEVLRKAMNVDDTPRKPKPREHQASIHAYAKSLESLEKVARLQRRLGMIPVEAGHMPVKAVAPGDMYLAVQTIIEELRRVKRQLVIGEEIEPAPLVGQKAPFLVYGNLARASLLLDGLVGRPTTSNDIYLHVMRVQDEIELIAAELSIPLEAEPPVVEGEKEPVAVAQQLVRAAYKIIQLQIRLGMDASRVPEFALESVTPADVYDATNFLLAETARMKMHLRVGQESNGRRDERNRTTADVFAQVLRVIRNLDAMGKAVDVEG